MFDQQKVFLVFLATSCLPIQFASAEGKIPHLAVEGSSVSYEIAGAAPYEERLKVGRRFLGIFSSGVFVTHQPAAGVNICATRNNEIGYAFFKEAAYRIDLKQVTITQVASTEKTSELFYQGRFEIGRLLEGKQLPEILYLEAPDLGSGPRNPCSLQ